VEYREPPGGEPLEKGRRRCADPGANHRTEHRLRRDPAWKNRPMPAASASSHVSPAIRTVAIVVFDLGIHLVGRVFGADAAAAAAARLEYELQGPVVFGPGASARG
jgi:hypothetical protein